MLNHPMLLFLVGIVSKVQDGAHFHKLYNLFSLHGEGKSA